MRIPGVTRVPLGHPGAAHTYPTHGDHPRQGLRTAGVVIMVVCEHERVEGAHAMPSQGSH